MLKPIYFDYAATTPLHLKVLSKMMPYLKNEFGNPSNLYKLARNSSDALKKSTETIAKILNCRPDEFIYTSGATESDNLAIVGTVHANKDERNKIIVSQVEHKGILSVCDMLEKEGFEVVKIPVLKNGLIDLNEFKKALDEKTILVSITMADSETGTIQPIAEISKIIKEYKESRIMNYELSKKKPYLESHNSYTILHNSFPLLHTDASQGAGYLDLNVEKLGVDLMTLSAHKIYGPKGIGGLFVRKGVELKPIIYGGGQNQLRSGTENVPGIVAFAQALSLCNKNKRAEAFRIKKLRDTLEKGIFKSIPKVVLNGHPKTRLPNFLNVSFLDIEGEAMLLYLDELGIMVSTGSACNSQSLEPSYVLTALGNPYEYVHGSIRFTLGHYNTLVDIKYVLKHLPKIVAKLRAISPLNLCLNQKTAMSDPRAFIGNQTPHFLRSHLRKKSNKSNDKKTN